MGWATTWSPGPVQTPGLGGRKSGRNKSDTRTALLHEGAPPHRGPEGTEAGERDVGYVDTPTGGPDGRTLDRVAHGDGSGALSPTLHDVLNGSMCPRDPRSSRDRSHSGPRERGPGVCEPRRVCTFPYVATVSYVPYSLCVLTFYSLLL